MSGHADGEGRIALRDVETSDLATFFTEQQDAAANHMAAFTAADPADHDAFLAHWRRILANDAVVKKAILVDGRLAGNVLCFEMEGRREVSYWVWRAHWGKGVATAALRRLLGDVDLRPLYARVVKDNVGSRRVLEKCGFTIVGEERGFANARGCEVEEYVLRLDRPSR